MRLAIETKEHACRHKPHDSSPTIIGYRASEPIVIVTMHNHDRDEMLNVLSVIAAGFDADVVAMVHESWQAESVGPVKGLNPVTGQPWKAGEMQEAVQHHQAIEKGWITECMSVAVANRAGDVLYDVKPFRFSGKHLVWIDSDLRLAMITPEGLIAERLRHIMLSPSGDQVIEKWGLRFDPDFDRDSRDAAVAKYLDRTFRCFVILTSLADQEGRIKKLRAIGEVIGSTNGIDTITQDPE